MADRKPVKADFTQQVKTALTEEPGLSVKNLADRLGSNRQFMAGVLAVLEERGEVTYRQVGPARIYFVANKSKGEPYGSK